MLVAQTTPGGAMFCGLWLQFAPLVASQSWARRHDATRRELRDSALAHCTSWPRSGRSAVATGSESLAPTIVKILVVTNHCPGAIKHTRCSA
jgi:hypothetical protein